MTRPDPGVRARLFDADGHDRSIDLATEHLERVSPGDDHRLVWVDIDFDAGGTLDLVVDLLSLDDRDRRRIEADTDRARLVQAAERLHLTVEALEPESDRADAPLERHELDIVAVPGLVVTVHRGRIDAIDRFAEGLSDETSLGVLDAAELLSAIVDEVISGYFRLVESIERQIDDLDQVALRGGPDVDLLAEIVRVRRQIDRIRRTLAPHRTALAALARPEMRAEGAVGQPWPGLVDRVERRSLRSRRFGMRCWARTMSTWGASPSAPTMS